MLFDNLISAVSSQGSVVSYKYDGLGRRIEKDVNGTITRYIYDNEDILCEYDGTNTLVACYTHGSGIDEPISMDRAGQTYFYHADGLGSIRQLSDNTGAVVQSYKYNSFGNIVDQQVSITNPYTFTGREYDSESGLYYYRARYYDPKLGRFLQEDPIGFDGGINFYIYADNNPVNLIDPYGLFNAVACANAAKNVYNLDKAYRDALRKKRKASTEMARANGDCKAQQFRLDFQLRCQRAGACTIGEIRKCAKKLAMSTPECHLANVKRWLYKQEAAAVRKTFAKALVAIAKMARACRP